MEYLRLGENHKFSVAVNFAIYTKFVLHYISEGHFSANPKNFW